ncbi:MAG: tRNA (adenosine(37)-N6)-threonylcarbamoyltransferase complex ATPase subunit type 1 TsaE [Bacteroidales bacterium]
MVLNHRIESKGIESLPAVAKKLIKSCKDSRIFAFYGDLGAGKTTLIKAICQQLGVTDTVNSPTFSLINVYQSPLGEIFHFDLYRIKSVEELFDIGYEDYFFSGNLCFIEWPDKIEDYLPPGTVKIKIQVDPADGTRVIIVHHE